MSAAVHSEPFDPHQRIGDIKVYPDPGHRPRANSLPTEREHVMTIRVYDWCPEHGFHTDPDLPNPSGGGL